MFLSDEIEREGAGIIHRSIVLITYLECHIRGDAWVRCTPEYVSVRASPVRKVHTPS
jgi:hypothetical protein